jgi:hypothetical protein
MLTWKISKYYTLWVRVCTLAFVIQHANHIFSVPYYTIICDLSGLTYISTLSHKWHDFWKKFNESKCVFWFSLQLLYKIFLIPRRIQQYINTHVCRYSGKIPFTLNILIKFKFSWQILEKSSNMKYNENPTSGSWFTACRQMDEWTDRQRN